MKNLFSILLIISLFSCENKKEMSSVNPVDWKKEDLYINPN